MTTLFLDPAVSAEAVTTRLPMVGRERDEQALVDLLRDPTVRLVTITGPGGIGKTRLGLQVAREAAEHFADGTAIVSLAAIRDAARVPAAILQALAGTESGSASEVGAVADAIGNRRLLLFLDNMEQVVAAGPDLGDLLARCPGLTLLVTSRMPLRLLGEIEYPLEPLRPPAASSSADVEAIAQNPAVQLFVQRARAIRSDFTVTRDNAAAVAEICRRLDGLPLAIELAAARTKVLSPQALLTRLTHSLQVLTGGPRDAPARLQSMRDAIDWSYELLDDDLQRFFRGLGVFAGGFSLEAVETVIDPNALDLIATLVDHSLVVPLQHVEDEPRFGLLETIREYAVDALRDAGELDSVRARHAAWYGAFVSSAAGDFFSAAETVAMDRIAREIANVRAALEWLDAHEVQRAAEVTYELWYYLGVRGYYREGLDWIERLAPARAALSPGADGKLDLAAGFLHWALGEYDRARDELERALGAFEALADRHHVGLAHFGLGSIERDVENAALAERHLLAALAIFEELDEPAWIGFSLSVLGALHRLRGRYDDAIAVLERGLAATQSIGYPGGMSPIVDHLGDIARERGDLPRALDYYRQTLGVWLELRDPHGAADSLAGVAVALHGLGDHEGAARFLAAAAAMYEGLGFARSRYGPAYKDEVIDRLRRQLGAERFEALWREGQALTFDAALRGAIAHRVPEAASEPAPLPRADAAKTSDRMERFGLTRREAEILALLIEGKTNAEIGEQLFISPRTAGTHVANIYGKLGVSSRAALVAAVMRTDAAV